MLPFSITNDAVYVKVAPGKPQTSRVKVFLGLLLWAVIKKTTEILGIIEKYFCSFTAQFLLQLIIINF